MKIFRLNPTFLAAAVPFKCSYQVFPESLFLISKLVLEKQEMEWEKESLQHRIESVTNQHTDEFFCPVLWAFIAFLTLKMNLTFQGKYQVIAELKDKEINNLKEELKSLQVVRYMLDQSQGCGVLVHEPGPLWLPSACLQT
uniref:Uncharacterized protein n=1 Tax=Oreochromis aureus TaxID=47969 RepID=A0A668RIF9_OREAU